MVSQLALALLAGIFAGALFSFIQIPIPAPPNLAGILGIVGIFLGYQLVQWAGVHVDILQYFSAIL